MLGIRWCDRFGASGLYSHDPDHPDPCHNGTDGHHDGGDGLDAGESYGLRYGLAVPGGYPGLGLADTEASLDLGAIHEGTRIGVRHFPARFPPF